MMFLATDDSKLESKPVWVGEDGAEQKNARVTEVEIAGTGRCFLVISAIELGRAKQLFADMKKILPVMLLLVIVLSFSVSGIYTRFVTSPVLKTA